eukprot:3993653-Prymnesium_polylepis.1
MCDGRKAGRRRSAAAAAAPTSRQCRRGSAVCHVLAASKETILRPAAALLSTAGHCIESMTDAASPESSLSDTAPPTSSQGRKRADRRYSRGLARMLSKPKC